MCSFCIEQSLPRQDGKDACILRARREASMRLRVASRAASTRGTEQRLTGFGIRGITCSVEHGRAKATRRQRVAWTALRVRGRTPASRPRSAGAASLPDDEADDGREKPVARERRPSSRGGVQLPEAAAVRSAPAGQVSSDADDEVEQERKRPQGTPEGRGGEDQRGRHGQPGQRHQDPTEPPERPAPKCVTARRDPGRSTSLATPANRKTRDGSKRAANRAAFILDLLALPRY